MVAILRELVRIAWGSLQALLDLVIWIGDEELYARSILINGHHYFIVPFVEDPYVQLD